eukprot:TRINITY_DN51215_c0_g1_i1.p1 TRINITY_DN51215_c0_g1~~TRINITY_DN51215_c0_g1_i1.p1  ORF type:complete len:459 (-),score=63.68 TRINITY_DN51215_c0_g1_i1:85-1281(-)
MSSNRSSLKEIVGWRQPAEEIIRDPSTRWFRPKVESHHNSNDAVGAALILGLDPWFGPSNLFHFIQLVLPAFVARVRLAWADGNGGGLLDTLPRFDPVVLADPSGASRLPWQRGLLDLVTGGSQIFIINTAGQYRQMTRKYLERRQCFQRAIISAQGPRDRGSTGKLDHSALLLEVSRRLGVPVSPVELRNVIFIQRGHGMPPYPPWKWLMQAERRVPAARRAVQNEAEVTQAMRDAIKAFSGGSPRAPDIHIHAENQRLTFADQARIFSKAALLVGVVGGGLVNMLFMPPGGVVMILQPVRVREDFAGMAAGCGHYPVPFFVRCLEDPMANYSVVAARNFSARSCGEIAACKNRMNFLCYVHVDIPTFRASFEAAYSYAFYYPPERHGGIAVNYYKR